MYSSRVLVSQASRHKPVAKLANGTRRILLGARENRDIGAVTWIGADRRCRLYFAASSMLEWRNRQTRMVQVHVPVKGVGVQLPPRAPRPGFVRDFFITRRRRHPEGTTYATAGGIAGEKETQLAEEVAADNPDADEATAATMVDVKSLTEYALAEELFSLTDLRQCPLPRVG